MRRRIATATVGGAEIELLADGRGAAYTLAFDGPGGLEWSYAFDYVRCEGNLVRLLRGLDRRPPCTVGTLEGAPSAYGRVGKVLAAIADE